MAFECHENLPLITYSLASTVAYFFANKKLVNRMVELCHGVDRNSPPSHVTVGGRIPHKESLVLAQVHGTCYHPQVGDHTITAHPLVLRDHLDR